MVEHQGIYSWPCCLAGWPLKYWLLQENNLEVPGRERGGRGREGGRGGEREGGRGRKEGNEGGRGEGGREREEGGE